MELSTPFKCPYNDFSCINVDPNGVLSPECETCHCKKSLNEEAKFINIKPIDLNENIRIAAEAYWINEKIEENIDGVKSGFIDGALSQQAKEYWFAEFQSESRIMQPFEREDEVIRQSLRRIGVVGHGAMVFGCDTHRSGKTQSLRGVIQGIEEEGVKVVVVGFGESTGELVRKSGIDLPTSLKGSSEIHEFIRRPEIVMRAPDVFKDEEIILTSNTSQYFPPKEVKSWDRKHFPQRMNNPKAKKRNKR